MKEPLKCSGLLYQDISDVNSFSSRNGYFVRFLRQAQILILEILSYIPAVKIFAFLELEQNISFLEGYYNGCHINVPIPIFSEAIIWPLSEVY